MPTNIEKQAESLLKEFLEKNKGTTNRLTLKDKYELKMQAPNKTTPDGKDMHVRRLNTVSLIINRQAERLPELLLAKLKETPDGLAFTSNLRNLTKNQTITLKEILESDIVTL